jgi:hypothetical protein
MPLQKSREKALVFLTIGLCVGAIGASALTNLSRYISLFESDKILFSLCMSLMATTLFWFVGWFKFDNDEITIISDYVVEENRLRQIHDGCCSCDVRFAFCHFDFTSDRDNPLYNCRNRSTNH